MVQHSNRPSVSPPREMIRPCVFRLCAVVRHNNSPRVSPPRKGLLCHFSTECNLWFRQAWHAIAPFDTHTLPSRPFLVEQYTGCANLSAAGQTGAGRIKDASVRGKISRVCTAHRRHGAASSVDHDQPIPRWALIIERLSVPSRIDRLRCGPRLQHVPRLASSNPRLDQH